jgi:hypothetical protein
MAVKWIPNGGRSRELCSMFFLLLVVAGPSFAQSATEGATPNIEITKLKWEKQTRLPRSFDPSVIPTDGAFADPASKTSVATTGAPDPTRRPAGRNPAQSPPDAFPTAPARTLVFYVYSMKIRNAGPKEIKGISWDYVFIDPNSRAELGRHQILSYAKISPNKRIGLQSESRTPPTRILQAATSDKDKHPKLLQGAVIECVLYADDSVWRNPRANEGACESLKNAKAALKGSHAESKR